MPDNIPFEDDITKTQLWKRIDEFHDSMENINGHLQDRINTLQDTVKAMVTAQLEENRQFVKSYDAELSSKLNRFTSDIQTIILNATTQIQTDNVKHIAELEEKIRATNDSISTTVIQESKSYFNPMGEKLENMFRDLEMFKRSILETTGKFNTEAIQKISAINGKLDTTLEKIRKLVLSIT